MVDPVRALRNPTVTPLAPTLRRDSWRSKVKFVLLNGGCTVTLRWSRWSMSILIALPFSNVSTCAIARRQLCSCVACRASGRAPEMMNEINVTATQKFEHER